MRNSRFCTLLRLPFLFAVAAGLIAQTAAAQSATLIDNDQVRVLQATDQPHVKTKPHEHKVNRVMIYLNAGSQSITPQDGQKVEFKYKAGEVKWTPASGTHVGDVTSATPLRIVEVEVKKEADPGKSANTPLDPLKVDPKDYKLEFENAQVRVVRVKMAAHRKVPMHEHLLNRVVVYLTDQNGSMTTPDGKTDTAKHKAGDASWGVPTKHSEENLQDSPFEAIVVELKN